MQSGRVSAIQAHRRGLWRIRIWPAIVAAVLIFAASYGVFLGVVPVLWSLVGLAIYLLIWFLWSLYYTPRWLNWMALHSHNPKTTYEFARTSYLKTWKKPFLFWSGKKKKAYKQAFDEQMAVVRASYIEDAKERYKDKRPIVVHYRFANLVWILLFELILMAVFALLFVNETLVELKVLSAVFFGIGLLGVFYTIRSIWRRNVTVLEITIHGITIQGHHYGWDELDRIDIVRENVLVYKKFKGAEQELKLKNLSLTGSYLDELILFYRQVKTPEVEE